MVVLPSQRTLVTTPGVRLGDRVYRTVIPRNVALAEAPSYGQSILKYNKNSRGSMAYLALAGEILRRAAKQNHYVNQ